MSIRRADGRLFRGVLAALAAALVIGGAMPAAAIIRITFPVSKLYQEAAVIVVGDVARVNAGSLECAVRETLKGRLPDATLTVETPAELAGQLKAGQPAVFFINGDIAIFHLADAWYEAGRTAGGQWGNSRSHGMVKNYPGRTTGLAAIVREIKAGNKGIQDAIGHEFVGTLENRGNLGVRATFLLPVYVNDDRNLDLVIGTAGGVRLFLAEGERYVDATDAWGLKDAAGGHGAAGDVNGDGKADLLLGRTLWLRNGDRFAASRAPLRLPTEETWAAASLADADGDGLTDVIVLTRTGELRTARTTGPGAGSWPVKSVALWSGDTALAAAFSRDWGDDGAWYVLVVHPGDIVRYPVGNAADPRSDFRRLTGISLAEVPNLGPLPLRVDLCTPLDYDGNGRTDLLLVTGGGGTTLANRGYGALLINAFMHKQFRSTSEVKPGPKIPKLPFELAPSLCIAPGKRAGKTGTGNAQNLFLLRGDGELLELVNAR